MKKTFFTIAITLIIGFINAENFPSFPMTIYGNIKIGESDLSGGTLKVYSTNQELISYDITESGKYGSDNVAILPLLLNEFEGNLDFKVTYNSKTYIIDYIDDSNKNEICPDKTSIIFTSANCRYDIKLKEERTDTGSSSNTGNNHSGHGQSSSNNDKTKNLTGNNTTNTGNNLTPNNDNFSNNEETLNNDKTVLENGFTKEQNDAYQFSYKNGITTKISIEDAEMKSPLTRIATAKMLSQYAINILKKVPDNSRKAIFKDITFTLDSDYNNGVTLAYQLGIMGVNMNGYFRPYDTITRAEFGTALSRMAYGIADGKNLYYTTHLNKLKEEGIMKETKPDLIETRGYAMLMLMRAANKYRE